MPPSGADDWLTIAQVAARLGLSAQQVHYAIRQGRLSTNETVGTELRIDASQLRGYVQPPRRQTRPAVTHPRVIFCVTREPCGRRPSRELELARWADRDKE